jgi:hypothetical protein
MAGQKPSPTRGHIIETGTESYRLAHTKARTAATG